MNERLVELFYYLVERGFIKKADMADMSLSAYDYDRLKEFETLITQKDESADLQDIKSRFQDTVDKINYCICDLESIINEIE